MYFRQRFVPGLAIASYLVGDEKSGRAAVVDPTRDVDWYIETARRQRMRITDVLETHVHADYVSGARELKARLAADGVTIHCSGEGGDAWVPRYADRVVADGDEVALGDVRLRALHTPGHTLEHVTWLVFDQTRSVDVPWLALTGDFLFVGDVGRPDLLGAEAQKELAEQLYQSVFDRLEALPEFVEVHAGHGQGSLCGKALSSRVASTVGFERRFNPALRHAEEQSWVDRLLADMPPAPPYFQRMKRVNQQGPAILGPELPGRRPLSASQVHQGLCENCQTLDLRSKEAFAAGHVPGSINIALSDTLPTWAGWVLEYDRPLLLVLDDPSQHEAAATHLVRVGFDEIHGYLDGGIGAWEAGGYPLERIETLSVHELKKRLEGEGDDRPAVLDVRTASEWRTGHIDGATHIHTGDLSSRLDEVPADRPVAVLCGSGERGSIAASLLKRAGRGRVLNVLGGMTAWRAAGLPMIKPEAKAAA